MKLNKKKVFTLALAVCLIAILSMGSLAWFTDSDTVTNDFLIAGSEDSDPDDIFSVDVWEEGDTEDDGLVYEDVLPGDTLDKIAHVENTGAYPQYIRVKITVSGANVWQEAYSADMVPVTEFVNVDLDALYGIGSYVENNAFVYYLYYNEVLEEGQEFTVFTEAYLSEDLTQEQAALLAGGFEITVVADAVQTENVGADVYEAFKTVGMEKEVNTVYVGTKAALLEAVANGGYIVLANNIKLSDKLTVAEDVEAVIYLDDYTLTTAAVALDYSVVVKGELTVEGEGQVKINGYYGIGATTGSKLTINGGSYVHDGDYMIGCFGGNVTLNNGDFAGNYCIANNFAEDSNGNTYDGKVTVNGGTYTVKATEENIGYEGAAFLGNVKVGKNVTWSYLASDAKGLAAAVSAGGNIVLTKNVTLKEKLLVETNVVLNLNGYTLTTAAVKDNYGVVIMGGDLTIEGEGTVKLKGLYGIGTATTGGNLTINGGYFVHEGDYMIGCFGGKVTINGGSFLAAYCVLNNFDGYTGKAVVNGGTFALSELGGAIFYGKVTDNR